MEPRELGVGASSGAAEAALRSGAPADSPPTPARDPRAAQVLAISLLVGALGCCAVLVARGESWPPVGPMLMLVALLALAGNRGAFFPTELVATGEAAVLFAAVVGFRADAVLLGPLLVGLAFGPLDFDHWTQRAYVRMAYNSGNQALATLGAALAFRAVASEFGSSLPALIGAAALAAVPYVITESLFGVALLRALGERSLRESARHQWVLNGLALPLACTGAVAGYLATSVGWWLALLVLAPLPWIPELLLVRVRRLHGASSRTHTRVLCGCVVVVAFAVASGLALSSSTVALPMLVGFSIVLGLELRVSNSRAVPPLAAAAAVTAAVIAGSDSNVMGALVGATTTATAWALARNSRAAAASWAITFAGLAGLACGAVTATISPDPDTFPSVLVAAIGGAVYCLVAVAACRSRMQSAASAAWSAPLVFVAALLASSGDTLGVAGAVLCVAGIAGALALVAWSAAPPWDSRFLGGFGARAPRHRRVAVLVLAAVAVGVATLAWHANARGAVVVLSLAAAALTETVVAMTLAMIRQWRFTPRARLRVAGVLLAIATLVGIAYLPLAFDGTAAAIAVLAVLLLPAVALGWRVVELADRASLPGRAGVTRRAGVSR